MRKSVLKEKYPREYRIWKAMKARCYSPCLKDSNYQKNNIQVCDRWRYSFDNFIEDMGEAPIGYSIDRINNLGNYEPSNCRWADDYTQAKNKSVTRYYTHNGITMCLKDWAKEIGVTYICLFNRINRGYSFEEAISSDFSNIVKTHRGFSSLHDGISYHKGHKKWQSYIYENGKQVRIGEYDTEEEAINAHDKYLSQLTNSD